MNEFVNVAVLIYPGVELIDMNGPVDVFLKANRFIQKKYEVFTVSEVAEDVESEGSAVLIKPEYTLSNCPQPDVIVIPGQIMPPGSSTTFGESSDALIAWIQDQAKHPGITIMSVCVGAYILAKTGLLDNKKATTHYQAIGRIQELYPIIEFIKNVRFVPDGNIITTGGVTSGIDGALYLVEKMDGAHIASRVADTLVYNREAPLPPNTILS